VRATRPNILWICTDQQRFDTIHALGNHAISTPNLDRLIREGTAFTSAYCQSPICTPSRASFLTGRYPSTVHASMNGNEAWAEAAPLVTAMLRDLGYDCALAGKFHLAGAEGRVEPRPRDDGYRVFRWSHSPKALWGDANEHSAWMRAHGVDPGDYYDQHSHHPVELHQTKWCVDAAMDFISDDTDAKPWLMSINIFDPHEPFDPPPEYLGRYDSSSIPGPHFRPSDLYTQASLEGADFQTLPADPDSFDARSIIAAYYAMIEQIDSHVGRLLDFLDKTGRRSETLVIFMSDHGEALGDHGLLKKGCRFYEGLTRVPLVFSWPGVIAPGRSVDDLVELTDLVPTLLEIAGAPAPPGLVGHSLAGAMMEDASPYEPRSSVRCEYYRALNPAAPGRDRFAGTFATMIRTGDMKLSVYHGLDHGELYDLENDPWEHENLWDNSDYNEARFSLLLEAFAQTALATDTGPEQTRLF
jgi:arylsulfatase A-like enzyme